MLKPQLLLVLHLVSQKPANWPVATHLLTFDRSPPEKYENRIFDTFQRSLFIKNISLQKIAF